MVFTRYDQEETMWDQLLQADEGQLAALDGVWQDPLDELLVIDTDRMEYMAYSSQSRGVATGTLADAHDGRGPYLFLNGRAYPKFSLGNDILMLYFYPSQTQEPDGTFSGVFYQQGTAQEIALGFGRFPQKGREDRCEANPTEEDVLDLAAAWGVDPRMEAAAYPPSAGWICTVR